MKLIKVDKNYVKINNINLYENKTKKKSINEKIEYLYNQIFKANYMKNENYKLLMGKKNDIKKQVNLGILILRAILCFWVVSFHNMNRKKVLIRKILQKHFHVPTFFIISFYYLLKNYNGRNIKKINQRFERLLIPYIIYPIIIWVFNNLLFLFTKNNRFNRILSLNDFIFQLIFGRKFMGVFWFQFMLIFLTIFFFILVFLEMNILLIFYILSIISYFFQYSGYNYNFFINYQSSVKGSIGYLVEIIPIIASGLTLSSLNIINRLDEYKNKTLIFLIIIIYFIFKYDIFIDINGFCYKGIITNFGSIPLFIFFSLLPINNIENRIIVNLIKYATQYTNGVYCLHSIVSYYLRKINILLVINREISGCIIIYIISYFISFLNCLYLSKTKLKYLFI